MERKKWMFSTAFEKKKEKERKRYYKHIFSHIFLDEYCYDNRFMKPNDKSLIDLLSMPPLKVDEGQVE